MNIPIVYEDDWLLVVNKPSGLLTIPAPQKSKRTLLKILNEDLESKKVSYRLHPCHRLDQGTSGLIIFAKGKSIQQRMMLEFKLRRVGKTYIALVKGRIPVKQGEIQNPICGKPALTRYWVILRDEDFSMVKVQPLTGRRNQIRLHFKQIGHPMIGEDRFAFRRDFKVKAKKLCLHAQQLDFLHPVTQKTVHLEIDLPEHFKRFIKLSVST